MRSRRVASARPPPGGAARSSGRGPQVGPRARELWRALLDGFKQHDPLTYSSAISFQILTAVVPFVMTMLALAGLLCLDGVWRDHVAPEIRAHVSADVFSVLSSAVDKVFSGDLTALASYGPVFGRLASVIVMMAYLYLSTTTFLFGAQLDAIIRAQATGTLSGVEVDPSQRS